METSAASEGSLIASKSACRACAMEAMCGALRAEYCSPSDASSCSISGVGALHYRGSLN